MAATPFEKNLIIRFAKHYSVAQRDAEICLREANWNWARAFEALVKMYKAELAATLTS